MIRTSTKDNTGIEAFENTIKDMFFGGMLSFNEEVVITSMRHKQALEEARRSMNKQEWSLDTCLIGQCHWTEGFARVFSSE